MLSSNQVEISNLLTSGVKQILKTANNEYNKRATKRMRKNRDLKKDVNKTDVGQSSLKLM